jgi:hypothetical protein
MPKALARLASPYAPRRIHQSVCPAEGPYGCSEATVEEPDARGPARRQASKRWRETHSQQRAARASRFVIVDRKSEGKRSTRGIAMVFDREHPVEPSSR